MFKIYDGREYFYQWDLDRKLIVEDPSITEVHFCNRTDNCSLVCETYVEDGVTLANVPNILLQTDWKIHVYAYDGAHTKHDECYEVKSRTKPSDYVYEETEIRNYASLDARVTALEKNGGGGGGTGDGAFEVVLSGMGVPGEIETIMTHASATYDEIKEVFNNGREVIIYYFNGKLDLSYRDRTQLFFTGVIGTEVYKVICSEDDEWTYEVTPLATGEKIGDIETALDNIIEIQNSLLGVSE